MACSVTELAAMKYGAVSLGHVPSPARVAAAAGIMYSTVMACERGPLRSPWQAPFICNPSLMADGKQSRVSELELGRRTLKAVIHLTSRPPGVLCVARHGPTMSPFQDGTHIPSIQD